MSSSSYLNGSDDYNDYNVSEVDCSKCDNNFCWPDEQYQLYLYYTGVSTDKIIDYHFHIKELNMYLCKLTYKNI